MLGAQPSPPCGGTHAVLVLVLHARTHAKVSGGTWDRVGAEGVARVRDQHPPREDQAYHLVHRRVLRFQHLREFMIAHLYFIDNSHAIPESVVSRSSTSEDWWPFTAMHARELPSIHP